MLSSEKARQPLLLIIPKCTRSLTEEQMIRNRFNVCTFLSVGSAHVHMLNVHLVKCLQAFCMFNFQPADLQQV